MQIYIKGLAQFAVIICPLSCQDLLCKFQISLPFKDVKQYLVIKVQFLGDWDKNSVTIKKY